MDSKLKTALHYAQQGWTLFPVKEYDPEKKQHRPLVKWSGAASDNPDKIKAWADLYPGCYFCVALKQSGLTVIDVDTKGGKRGADTFFNLEIEHGFPDTLQSQTPSGGKHLFYKGSARTGANRLGPGVDIPVMVPIPGSDVPGKGLYSLTHERPIGALPGWVPEKAGTTKEREENSQQPLIELDQDHNIQRAINHLQQAGPAIEGNGGNDTTYRVLSSAKDFGISDITCLRLALEHYNERCQPPWTADEMAGLVKNAYQYSRSAPGSTAPEADFDPVPPPDMIKFASARELASDLTPPDWLIRDYIEKDTVNLIYGETGSYKSFLVIDQGMHIATGRDWCYKPVSRGAVFYIAGEGHGGIKRRVSAWLKHHEMEHVDIPFYVSPHAIQIDDSKAAAHLIQSIQFYDRRPELIIIDTLATNFGGGDENSAKDMGKFLDNISRGIRTKLGCAVIIVHHTGHQNKGRARGSYALGAGVDSSYRVTRAADDYLVCLRRPDKMKDGLPPQDTWFETRRVEVMVDDELRSVTSLVPEFLPDFDEPDATSSRLGGNELIVVDIVGDNPGLAKKDIFRHYKAEKTKAGQKADRSNCSKIVDRLVEKRYIYKDGMVYCLTEGAEKKAEGEDECL